MFYLGAIVGLAVGFLASVAFPGVIAKLRSGYFSELHQAENYGGTVAGQIAKKL